MQSVSGGIRTLAVIALVALAPIATHFAFDYSSAKNTVAGAAVAPRLSLAVAGATEQPMVSLHFPAIRQLRIPVAVDPFAVSEPVAPVAAMPRARVVPQQAVAVPPMPYTHAGFIEEGGARMAVLARGDFLLSKHLGESVDNEFQLAALDPPALMHLPSGAVLPVPRPPTGGAPPRSTRPIVASAAQTNAPAEIEAEIAIALATPVPEPIVPSSFPLAR